MPGFLFLSRQVKLLGLKIIEPVFLHNILPVLNSLQRRYILERNLKQLTKEEVFGWYHILLRFIHFFFALYKLAWDLASSFTFSNQSFFVLSPMKSIPFFNFSRDHLLSTLGITYGRGSLAAILGILCSLEIICRWGSFAVLYRALYRGGAYLVFLSTNCNFMFA